MRCVRKGASLAVLLALVASPAGAAVEADAGQDVPVATDELACPSEDATVEDASRVAVECGQDVLIGDSFTEWSTAYATASGDVRTEFAATAVRQDSDGDGRWGAVDVAVSTDPVTDGSESGVPAGMLPVAGGVEPIWVNPGGAAGAGLPLAVIGGSDEQVSMFSGSLAVTGPTVVEDARVTYDLGGGVTLAVSVNPEGTSVTPVVRVADEAGLQRLRDDLLIDGSDGQELSLSFPLEASAGLTVAPTATGFEVRDVGGKVAFESGPALMWDSAGELGQDEIATADGGATLSDSTATSESSSVGGDDTADRLSGPVAGDEVALMDVSVADDVVTVVPDAQMLADPELAFPLHIDPSIGASSPTRWGTVRSAWPTTNIWKSTVSQALGFCDVSRDAQCDRDGVSRLFWHFGSLRHETYGVWLADLDGSDIKEATLSVYGTHSWDCTERGVKVFGVDAFTSDITWNNQPHWRNLQDTRAVSHKYECSNRRRIEFDVTGRTRTAANDNESFVSLGMQAADETSMTWWKRYRPHDARLTILFDRPPLPPTTSQTSIEAPGGVAQLCPDFASRPFLSSTRPILRARGSEPDGTGEVQVRFRVQDHATASSIWYSTWTLKGAATTWGAREVTGTAGLQSGKTYRWQVQVRSWDPATDGYGTTKWEDSPLCFFAVDTSYPNPPTVTSTNYPYRQVAGGVGTPIELDFGANGSGDVVEFKYSYNNQTFNQSKPAVSGRASATIPVTRAGLNHVVVRSYDRAGMPSDVTRYEFYVGFPFASAHWKFNDLGWETSPPSTAMNSESSSTGALQLSGVTWGRSVFDVYPSYNYTGPDLGPRVPDGAAVFDNAADVARAQGPAVDGTRSFTVSAFVRVDELATANFAAAVSQEPNPAATTEDGNTWSSFHLGYSKSPNCPTDPAPCWSFWHVLSEDDGPTSAVSRTEVPVVPGEWVHVVGIYRYADGTTPGDGKNSTVQAYACRTASRPYIGPVAGDAARFTEVEPQWTPWSASGPLRLGSGVTNGSPVWPFTGAIDEVRVYSGYEVDVDDLDNICTGADVP